MARRGKVDFREKQGIEAVAGAAALIIKGVWGLQPPL
jgi:hypothetical protein